ncbi:N-acetylneuraminate synthase family protein [Leptospira kmetyi]|uniref:General stress protein n=1 Tax=Leptospira kmetyi TaxID=408139 RepID=A0ABX4N5L8_9LEPT|nr:N-acetylneuraminate synthase family protein [Leptospira kmetyi]PJZ28682.1 general stress protein [Leptospira kmetyi]PJZ43129.1 general stress protein [Leptospira kmetyi]
MTNVDIIAECCQNHNGDREILKRMIHEAANTGANYCKIQAIRSKELTHRERFDLGVTENGITKTIKRPFEPEQERLKKLDLNLETEQWFVDECLRAGISPMTTVFTRDSVTDVKDMGFQAVKIASYDCSSYPLLRDVKKVWKKIYVSTGATKDPEIEYAHEILEGTDFTFLHCVTIYPTPIKDLNLRRMNYLRRFTSRVGFSDHTKIADTGLTASKIALALGADCIERHFTVLGPTESKDGPVSVNPKELKELVEFSRLPKFERMEKIKKEFPDWEISLGAQFRALTHEELLNRDYYRGRFASFRDGVPVYNWEDVIL